MNLSEADRMRTQVEEEMDKVMRSIRDMPGDYDPFTGMK